jgi:hypothetical protein
MFAIEKRGVPVGDSAPNPGVIKPATQQTRQNFEIFTGADLTQLPGRHKCAPRSSGRDFTSGKVFSEADDE